jgi:hypothetical protein
LKITANDTQNHPPQDQDAKKTAAHMLTVIVLSKPIEDKPLTDMPNHDRKIERHE